MIALAYISGTVPRRSKPFEDPELLILRRKKSRTPYADSAMHFGANVFDISTDPGTHA